MENKIENVSIITALKYFFDEPETLEFSDFDKKIAKIYIIQKKGAIKQFQSLSEFFWFLVKYHNFYHDEICITKFKYDIDVEKDERLVIANDDIESLSDTLDTYYHLVKDGIQSFIE